MLALWSLVAAALLLPSISCQTVLWQEPFSSTSLAAWNTSIAVSGTRWCHDTGAVVSSWTNTTCYNRATCIPYGTITDTGADSVQFTPSCARISPTVWRGWKDSSQFSFPPSGDWEFFVNMTISPPQRIPYFSPLADAGTVRNGISVCNTSTTSIDIPFLGYEYTPANDDDPMHFEISGHYVNTFVSFMQQDTPRAADAYWHTYSLSFTATNSSYMIDVDGVPLSNASVITNWRPTTIVIGNTWIDGFNAVDYTQSSLILHDMKICVACCNPPCKNLSPTTPPPSTSASTTGPSATCGTAPIAGAICVNGVLVYSGTVTIPGVIIPSSPILVNGDLTIVNGATITPFTNGIIPINVTGSVTVGSELVIVLQSPPMNGEVIPLITAANITGNFTGVTVEKEYIYKGCSKIGGAVRNDLEVLSVILSVSDCKRKGLSKGAIIAIAVVGGVLVITAVIILAIFVKGKMFTPKRGSAIKVGKSYVD